MTRTRCNPTSACLGIMLSLGTATALGQTPPDRLATCRVAARAPQAADVLGEVPPSRLEVLARGVNVVTLLDVATPPERLAVQFRLLRQMGLRHVRIPVAPEGVSPSMAPRSAVVMDRLDTAVCEALRADLGVIIDLHPSGRLGADDQTATAVQPELEAIWQRLAAHFASVSPERIFFEVLNEPGLTDAAAWGQMQEALLRRIRSVAPRHTVLLTGSPTSTAWALSAMIPSADRNVAYTFHFYAPMVFTHQGAEWDDNGLATVRGLPYPPERSATTFALARADLRVKPQIASYSDDFATDAPMRREIAVAQGWASQHHVPVVVTEFGVYRRFAPTPSRAAWFRDVRTLLESQHIGWTVWELDAGFGIRADLAGGCGHPGQVATALGLCGAR